MTRRLLLACALAPVMAGVFAPAPAAAETRYYSYEASDRLTRSLTRDITFEVERGLLGGVRVRRLYSNAGRAAVDLTSGGPDAVRSALPAGSAETSVYAVSGEGQGVALVRALCPGADAAWLVLGRIRMARPLTAQAVGQWTDGTVRHCAPLSYAYGGEWAAPPRQADDVPASSASPITR